MTKKELSAISDLAIDHDLIVMSDELWEDILYDDHKHVSIASLSPEISNRTLTVFGFSKAYNIAGLQIGYAVSSNTKMITDMKKKTRGIFRETTTISQAVAKTILSGKVDHYLTEELRYLHRVRDYSIKRLKEIPGVICNALEGTYLLFPNITSYSKTSTEMVQFLRQDARVEVSNGSMFGTKGDGHIRINIGTSLNILRTAFNRIEKSLDKLR
jgi:aspartate/methionine/tyrosine aminotransferase